MGTFAGVCSCRRCPDSFLNFTRIILNTQSSVLTPKPQELDFKQGFTKLCICISSRQRVPASLSQYRGKPSLGQTVMSSKELSTQLAEKLTLQFLNPRHVPIMQDIVIWFVKRLPRLIQI